MRHITILMASTVLFLGTISETAIAADSAPAANPLASLSKLLSPHHTTGQPGQSCGSDTAPNTPGNAASAPGSAFNPSGTAGSVYAGQQPQNSKNTASVAQYDVACFNQP